MSAPEPARRWSTRRRVGVSVVVAVVLYALVGFLIIPAIVESQIVAAVEAQTGVVPRLGSVRFNPFGLRLTIEGFALSDPVDDRDVLSFDVLAADVRSLGLLRADVSLEEVVVVRPRVALALSAEGELNIMRMLAGSASASTDENVAPEEGAAEISKEGGADDGAAPAEPLIIDVDRIRIEAGELVFVDHSQSPSFEIEVDALDLVVDGFTTRTGEDSPVTLLVRVGDATELRWEGSVRVDPLQSAGRLALTALDLRVPWDFVSDRVRFEVERGTLDVEVSYEANLVEDLQLTLDEGRVGLRDFVVRDPAMDTEVVRLPEMGVSGIRAKVEAGALRSLSIGEVAGSDGRLASWIEPDGAVHLARLFEPVAAGEGPAEAGVPTGHTPEAPAEASEPDGPPVEIAVDRIVFRDFDLDLEDRSAVRPVPLRLSPFSLEASGYRSVPGSDLTIDLKTGVGEVGSLAVRGPISVEPLSARLQVVAEAIGLGDFQPYLEGVAQLDVPSGSLSTALDVDFGNDPSGGFTYGVTGRLQIDELTTIDRRMTRKFLEWQTLRIEGIDLAPASLSVTEIGLSGAAAHVVLDTEGRSNIEAIFTAAAEGEAESAGAEEAVALTDASDEAGSAPPFAVRIDKVSLDGVGAEFDDLSLDPNFSLSLGDLRGTVEGLSSERVARAKVDLAGRIDRVAPIRIDGQINPLSEEAYTDLRISVDGVSLPAFTPYAARFIGYGIDRGKLGLELDYRLSQRSLVAENHVSLQKFYFGQRVKSPDATSLPVPLAVAVMRDPDGDIEVDLPIRGNLDDPSFSVLKLLGKAVVNLVSRAATSPFAAVAGLAGVSGDELSRVDFDPGSDELSVSEGEKIARLAEALAQRPSLRLEIKGRADPAVDGPELAAARIDEAVRLLAFQSLSRRERRRIGAAEAMELEPAQRLQALERLHRERIGGDSRELIAGETFASGDERRARLAERTRAALVDQLVLGDSDWRSLARARAAAVHGALIASQQVGPDRLFLVDVAVGAAAEGGVVPTELVLRAK